MQTPYIEQLPIPDVPPELQAPIVALVEQILAAKKSPLPIPPPPGEGTTHLSPAGGAGRGRISPPSKPKSTGLSTLCTT